MNTNYIKVNHVTGFAKWQSILKENEWNSNQTGNIERIIEKFSKVSNSKFSDLEIIKGIIHISKSIHFIKSGISLLSMQKSASAYYYRDFFSGYFNVAIGFEVFYSNYCLKINNIPKFEDFTYNGELKIGQSKKLKEYIDSNARFDLLIGLNKNTKEVIIKHLTGSLEKKMRKLFLSWQGHIGIPMHMEPYLLQKSSNSVLKIH